jgi:hypothetical protein
VTDGKEWVRETELAYVIQSGAFKDLSVKWRNSSIRRDYSNNEFDENRLIFNYHCRCSDQDLRVYPRIRWRRQR